jgi:hypothetical protein
MFDIDTDANKLQKVWCDRGGIDSVYLIDEERDLFIQDNEDNVTETHVVPGDIIVSFYTNDFPNKVIVVKSDKWTENIKTLRANEQKRKEEWASKQSKNIQKCSINEDGCSDCEQA